MKITDVEAVILRQHVVDAAIADGSQDDLLIRITTDEGLQGIGEVDSAPEAVRALVEQQSSHAVARSLKELLVGEDPLRIEELWKKLYLGLIYVGRRGIALHALSGVDIALWDIKGKALGKPVLDLLGGAKRDAVLAYASTLMPNTPTAAAARVSDLCAQGYKAVKLGWGPLGDDPRLDVELAAAAKEAAGENEILIDAGLGYGSDVETAIWVARELEKIGIFWLEEPFEPDEYEAYAALADAVDLRIAAGEQETTVWGFRELIERGHVDVVQPDVTRCGGITEWLRIAELGRSYDVMTVPHAWKSGIVKAASLHCNQVIPEAVFQEACVAATPINQDLTREKMQIDREGRIRVPEGPGLGITLDEALVSELRVS